MRANPRNRLSEPLTNLTSLLCDFGRHTNGLMAVVMVAMCAASSS